MSLARSSDSEESDQEESILERAAREGLEAAQVHVVAPAPALVRRMEFGSGAKTVGSKDPKEQAPTKTSKKRKSQTQNLLVDLTTVTKKKPKKRGRQEESDDSSSSSNTDSSDDDSAKRKKRRREARIAKKAAAGAVKEMKKADKKKKKKRRTRSETDSDSDLEAEPELLEETVELKDDGVSELNMELRHKLRVPNADPAGWWRPPFASRKITPVRGSSMYLEAHMGASRVNPAALKMMHDRVAGLKIRMLLAKNAEVSIRENKILKLDGNSVLMDKKWAGPESVAEIVEALHNFCAAIHMTRAYSYEGLSLMRASHDVGFFLGVVESEKQQMEWLEQAIDSVLTGNAQKAREGKCPLTYDQIKNKFSIFLQRKGKAEAGLYGIGKNMIRLVAEVNSICSDPYAGRKRLTDKEAMKREILEEVNRSKYREEVGKKEDGKKKKDIKRFDSSNFCGPYNLGNCERGDCGKTHKCNKVKGTYTCARNHPAISCNNDRMK